MQQGKNVLYITLEMAEERIAERIDCNLMGVGLDELYHMRKVDFNDRMKQIHEKTHGKLVIKEYPTASAHAGHFKILLDELKLKKNFIPDLICIDYINICASQRLKGNSTANSYTIIKGVAEELRGLAVQYDVPILSATQTNRSGWQNSDIEMSDTSESAGLPMTVDWMFAMIRTEELDAMGQLMVKQLKSRYNDVNYYKRFVVGVDIAKFTLHDVDQPVKDLSDTGKTDDGPVFDKSSFGSAMKKRGDTPELDFS
jgi:replicative DNA helicase